MAQAHATLAVAAAIAVTKNADWEEAIGEKRLPQVPAHIRIRLAHGGRAGLTRGATTALSRITTADHVLMPAGRLAASPRRSDATSAASTALAAQPPSPLSASNAITSSRSGPVIPPSPTWATRPPTWIS
jgi:hypothetical protein